jgi:prolyl-tRNA synthetase
MADESPVAVMVRGDCDVNEVKVRNHLGCETFRMATHEEVMELTGAAVGYAGPIGLPESVRVLADHYVNNRINFECGANRTDYHNINVNFGRDVEEPDFGEFRLSKAGDGCPNCCEGTLEEMRGIEVGHIFKLGTKYSEAMNATFKDEKGQKQPCVMGCYGIGISRIAAAAIEQNHDENGMIWPASIAPFAVHLICINPGNDDQRTLAEQLYGQLQDAGVEVLYDDRKASPGVKFKDADLIGIPHRVIVGRAASEGRVEYLRRVELEERSEIELDQVLSLVS